ncbi:DDT domain-containing protein DDB_G0282237 isoform X1 [Cucurbita moschata]|uniref:DDT domain-containing protein DDB_G0282237 isoform X1 n=1 Tax=Cucurbita moschata TaxID=3662 RepID=A0A6J1EVW7_CUCMO|nr:DDT domain-containing protein DDB_G0282237 isoform X1 [Cucurbita moschata]
MPLLKRKPFPLADSPKDLENYELVYQVRFTKEVFRDYSEYLSRINLYRRRVWMCKFTGKSNLTYEEALVSEKCAAEKVQQFPKDLIVPALQIIQYSMLSLKDLADTIAVKLQEFLFVGTELYGRREDQIYPCKIVKVLENDAEELQYEVVWLDKNKKVTETALLSVEDLVQKKPPLSRRFLKSFIRESTYRSAPWVLHDKLAQNHGISTDLPQELRSKAFFRDGLLVCNKKRKSNDMEASNPGKCKRRDKTNGSTAENGAKKAEGLDEDIKYPIDDLLVQPGADDPVFSERPSPSREFKVPMNCVGDLLMVWDVCSSFSRLLNLWPFSLDDFERAIYHKESNVPLLVEAHSAYFRLLLKDNGEYSSLVEGKKRKMKITLVNWTEYLCDFLEMIENPKLCANTATIKRGHYGLLDTHVKLGILCELVNHSLESNIFREKLDEIIEQRQALGATRRGEALEEGRKRREEKERLKSEPMSNGHVNGHLTDPEKSEISKSDPGRRSKDSSKNRNGVVISTQNGLSPVKSEDDHPIAYLKKMAKKRNSDVTVSTSTNSPKKEAKDHRMEVLDKNTIKERREYYERELEKRSIKTNPLGKDRNHNRYWWFRRDGRIFVESSDSKEWGYYSNIEELDAFMGSLNCKGERERELGKHLEKSYRRICVELNKRSKDITNQIAAEEAVLRRSTRVRAPPRENPATAYLRYVNRWKED